MRVADLCTRSAVSIAPSGSIIDAAQLMRARHVGSLVVVEERGGQRIPVGMLTDRDIVLAVIAAGVEPGSLTVGDVMTHPPVTCHDSDSLFEAIQRMRDRGVRRLPVIDAGGALVGVLSADDVYGALGAHLQQLGHALARGQLREMEARD